MKYSLSTATDAGKALQYLSQLTAKGAVVDIKEVKPKRSLPQNAYLHLLLGAFGAHFGYTLEEAKLIYKELNGDLYKYEREVRGKTWNFYRSSADITKEEMGKSIDVLREWSERAGYPLPLATDQAWIQQLDNEIERNGKFL